jgi:hypothetical protein
LFFQFAGILRSTAFVLRIDLERAQGTMSRDVAATPDTDCIRPLGYGAQKKRAPRRFEASMVPSASLARKKESSAAPPATGEMLAFNSCGVGIDVRQARLDHDSGAGHFQDRLVRLSFASGVAPSEGDEA